jgi:hypothetical protein
MDTLTTICDKLRAYGKGERSVLREKALGKIILELEKSAHILTQDIDRNSLKSCLEGVAFHKNFQLIHLKDHFIPVFTELGFTQSEIGWMFRTTQQIVQHHSERSKKGRGNKAIEWGPDTEIPISLEEVEKMEAEDFVNFAITGARRMITMAVYAKDVNKWSVDIARSLILAQDQLKRSETEKMWKLNKRLLQFFTSEFVVKLTKILAPFKLRVDAKILVGEALQEGYIDLYKLFVKAQEQRERESELDRAVKQAKRRGKWKKPIPKVSGSIVLCDNAELLGGSASEDNSSAQEPKMSE